MLVAGGSINVTTYFSMKLAADGTAATGLTETDFDLQYVRSGAAPSTKADATAGTAGGAAAHVDNTVVEPDATDQPGLYRVDWPDAAFAAGVREVILTVKVATAYTEHLRAEIDGEVNVVEWGGTDVVAGAIPAVAADGVGGLPVSDAGGLDLDTKLANTNEVTVARMGALTDWINGGRLDLILDATLALLDDARTEPGDIAPPVNPDAMTKIDYLYKFLRNKIETTETRIHVYDNAGSNKDHSSIISDDTTTFTRGEFAEGDA